MLEKINKLLALTGDKADVFISTDENETDSGDNIQETFHRTSECINNEKIRQVIFSSGQMKFSSVIACMQLLSHHRIRFRIASPDGNYMIGSGTAISAEE